MILRKFLAMTEQQTSEHNEQQHGSISAPNSANSIAHAFSAWLFAEGLNFQFVTGFFSVCSGQLHQSLMGKN